MLENELGVEPDTTTTDPTTNPTTQPTTETSEAAEPAESTETEETTGNAEATGTVEAAAAAETLTEPPTDVTPPSDAAGWDATPVDDEAEVDETSAAGDPARESQPVQTAHVLFRAPDLPVAPVAVEPDEPAPSKRRRRRGADTGEADGASAAEGADDSTSPAERVEEAAADTASEPATEIEAETDDDGDEGSRRRRRRRGGRRRRKGAGDDESDNANGADSSERTEATAGADAAGDGDDGEAATDDDAESGSDGDEDSGGTRRRRRRRRRRGEPVESSPDDPEVTVVKVREPRSESDGVSSVEGSTRVEAKKQRRREGRDAGRRRAPVLTESEFLARREAVERSMVIRENTERTQIAVLEDDVLVEHYVANQTQSSLIGNVYLGRVQNVLPSMEAAFIDIGRGRNAVLYAGEVNWEGVGLEGQPKRIESALKSGQTVLVQVTKDPVGHKGARLTSQISLPGRYLVYIPSGGMNGISRKLPDNERTRLKQLLKEIVPDEAGVVVRTAAEGASEEELSRDVGRLRAQWEAIEKAAAEGKAPNLLYAEPDLLVKVVRDLFTEDFTKLVVAGDAAWDMVEGYVSHVAPHLSDRLERWMKPDDLFSSYRIDEQIMKALDRKVWLPSGGSLVIDRTEAMTVVDVNTGKFTGSGGNLEETVTKNNLEAAEEIVRQLRLRDIGGIIVVDFIDMVLESNRDLVLRRLVECLARDRTKHQVAEVTSLGLVQMTRKKIGTGLLEAFSEPCEACKGRGSHIRLEPVRPAGSSGSGSGSSGSSGGSGSTGSSGSGSSNGDGERRSRRRRRGGSGGGAAANTADDSTDVETTGPAEVETTVPAAAGTDATAAANPEPTPDEAPVASSGQRPAESTDQSAEPAPPAGEDAAGHRNGAAATTDPASAAEPSENTDGTEPENPELVDALEPEAGRGGHTRAG